MTELPWVMFIATAVCCFGAGYTYSMQRETDIIEKTIMYLMQNRYIRYSTDKNGETQMHEFDEK